MKCLKINESLYVVEQKIENDNIVQKREPTNFLLCYDRSGSMSYHIVDLCTQLKNFITTIPKGDTVSIGYFSGEGQYSFIIKGFKISDDSDYQSLYKLIDKNNTTIGLTCFSEILMECNKVVEDLSVFSNKFSFCLFTDGYPVVSDTKKEVENIFKAIDKIKGKLHTAVNVGFGSYYNKDLMTKWTEKIGGILIHSSLINEYSLSLQKLLNLTNSTSPKKEVKSVVKAPLATFTISPDGIMLYDVDEAGKLYVSPSKESTTSLYYITDKSVGQETNITEEDYIGLYASSFVMTQKTKTDIALEIMGKVGDKEIIDSITNAFTIDEYGYTENKILNCVVDETKRFKSGKDLHYLPPIDAFCVFDVLEKLTTDEEAKFYPYHENFKYNKIGKSTLTKAGYPKFIRNDDCYSPLSDLVWNESRMNLSIRCNIKGKIKLNKVDDVRPSDIGFSEHYPTYRWKNYTIIADGVVNVKNIYVSTSKETYEFFKDKKVVIDDNFDDNGIYGIDISKLPAMNRAMCKETSGTELCKKLYRMEEIKGILKSLKYYLEEEFPEPKTIKDSALSEEQQNFLIANGIDMRSGAYSPSVEIDYDVHDMYIAKIFDIKIAKLSSLPTVKKVLDKLSTKKSLTLNESIVNLGICEYLVFKTKNDDSDFRKMFLEKRIEHYKKELNSLRSSVNKVKFAILQSKKNFDEFDSREGNVLTIDGNTFTFVYGEQQITI